MHVNTIQKYYKQNPEFNRNTVAYTPPFNQTLRQKWEAEAAGKTNNGSPDTDKANSSQQDANQILNLFKMQAAMGKMNSSSARIDDYLNSYKYLEDMQPMIMGNNSSSSDLYSSLMKMGGMGGLGGFGMF